MRIEPTPWPPIPLGTRTLLASATPSDFPTTPGAFDPVHVLQRGCEVGDIVNMAAIAVVHAQASVEQLPLPV